MARSNVPISDLAVTLDRYQEILNIPQASFNGLNNPNDVRRYECPNVWDQSRRESLALALQQAREMRERELGYHLRQRYISNEEHTYTDGGIFALNMKHLISIGVETLVDVEDGVTLTHGTETSPNDPVSITVAAPSGVSGGEYQIYYPGEDVRIFPSKITLSGSNAIIQIPRSRLVKPELNVDTDNHPYYYENDNFLETVDVRYSYASPVNAVTFVWNNYDCLPNCDQTTQQGCAIIQGSRANRLSRVQVRPGLYTSGVFAAKRFTKCYNPDSVRISYYSGKQSSASDELMTIRLAHTLMPNSPCGCETLDNMWRRDTEREDALVTPYGYSRGATAVWLHDMRGRIGHGGMF